MTNLAMNQSMILILSAPSGGGKTSVAKKLLDQDKNLQLSISATTRKARSGEFEGVHYFFKNRTEFIQMSKQNEFLEQAEIYGNFYGTPIKPVEEILSQGVDVLFDIDFQGAYQIMQKLPDQVVSIFIKPPNIQALKNRLQLRAQDSQNVIDQRLNQAEKEIAEAKNYEYVVINDDFDQAVEEIRHIITKERQKRKVQ